MTFEWVRRRWFASLASGECTIHVAFICRQCRRGHRQHVSDQRGGLLHRRLPLGASRPVHEHLQDRHHVVSVRQPAVSAQVRIVDVRQFRHRPAEAERRRRHEQFHSQRRMGASRYDPIHCRVDFVIRSNIERFQIGVVRWQIMSWSRCPILPASSSHNACRTLRSTTLCIRRENSYIGKICFLDYGNGLIADHDIPAINNRLWRRWKAWTEVPIIHSFIHSFVRSFIHFLFIHSLFIRS